MQSVELTLGLKDFKSSEGLIDSISKEQLSGAFLKKLDKYVTPVLRIGEVTSIVEIKAGYSDLYPLGMDVDSSTYIYKNPNYLCTILVSEDLLTAKIVRAQTGASFFAKVSRKKNKREVYNVERLADKVKEELIFQKYNLRLDNLTKLVFSKKRNQAIKIIAPNGIIQGRKQIIEVGEDNKLLIPKIQVGNSKLDTVEVEPIKLSKLDIIFFNIKQKNRGIKITPLNYTLEVGARYMNLNKTSSLFYEITLKRFIAGRFSVGLGAAYFQLPYQHQLSTFPELPIISNTETNDEIIYNVLFSHKKYFSSIQLFTELELGIAPVQKGGHLSAVLGWEDWHWLALKFGFHNYALDIDQYTFNTFLEKADLMTIEKRFSFFTIGLQLKHLF